MNRPKQPSKNIRPLEAEKLGHTMAPDKEFCVVCGKSREEIEDNRLSCRMRIK